MQADKIIVLYVDAPLSDPLQISRKREKKKNASVVIVIVVRTYVPETIGKKNPFRRKKKSIKMTRKPFLDLRRVLLSQMPFTYYPGERKREIRMEEAGRSF